MWGSEQLEEVLERLGLIRYSRIRVRALELHYNYYPLVLLLIE